MRSRAAISVILICIGILLCCACGIPNPIPPRRPPISEDLVLWTLDPNGAPTPVANLLLFGNTVHIDASLSFQTPPCLAGKSIFLSGGISSQPNPTLSLAEKSSESAVVQLTADLQPQQAIYRFKTAPFDGILTLPPTCSPVANLPVKARVYPQLAGKWRLAADPPNASLSLQQSVRIESRVFDRDAQTLSTYSATLDLAGAACTFHGRATSVVSGYHSHYSLTFQSADGQTSVFADADIGVFNDRTPIHTRYTIHGGVCDGKTFTATLLPH